MTKEDIHHDEHGPFCKIPLSQGLFTLIDPENYDWLTQWKWHAQCEKRTMTYYAVRNSPPHPISGKRTQVRMAREIMKAGKGVIIDHSKSGSLDNRRYNLRRCGYLGNNRNASVRKDNTSGLKGVTWYKKYGKWMAQISVNRVHKNLGYFDTAQEAHEAYKRAALEFHGEFSRFESRPDRASK